MPSDVRVLGIDPGLAKVGWGVVEESSERSQHGTPYRLGAFGTILTRNNLPHAERLLAIFEELNNVISEYRPTEVAIEEVFQGINPKSAFLAGEGRGACILAAATRGLRVAEYSATKVKQAVTGNGRAAKQQVQAMVQRLLNLPEAPKPYDAADALAIAIAHLQGSPRAGGLRLRPR